MATQETPCAASSLLAPLLDGPRRDLVEVARTRVSVHYRTGDPALPVLTVCTPDAVRLPASLVSTRLPAPGPARVGDGPFVAGSLRWPVRRWWRPARPHGLPRPSPADLARVAGEAGEAGEAGPGPWRPGAWIGRGPGLTPSGDDLVAGALVAAHATGDPRLPGWRAETATALRGGRTTDVSRALLHHAADGYAVPPLAHLLTRLCLGEDTAAALAALVAVGHTSGRALLGGVLHTLSTRPTTQPLEGAA